MSEPIRIGMIMGKWIGGGVESIVYNYYKYIDKEKFQFDFICDSDSTEIPVKEIESMGGKVIIIPPYQKFFKYKRELKKVFEKEKYLIIHSHINALSIFPLSVAKKVGVPIRIAHSHTTSNKKEWKKDIIKKCLKPFSKVYANKYMCCSEKTGRWLFGNKEYEKGTVFLLKNAININEFVFNKNIRERKRKELEIDSSQFVIGHIGRFVKAKNQTFLIDIFSEIVKKEPNSLLVLAGQGPLMENIKKKVYSLGLYKNTKILNQRKDISEIYQAFDVFVLPSLYEGLPVVGIEAQAAGLRCVFSNNITKEVKLLNSTIFLSIKDNPQKWRDCILKNIGDSKRIDTSNEITQKGYNIQKEVKKLEEKYNEYLIEINYAKKQRKKV